MRINLLFFGAGQSTDVAVIAILAIASTAFVHANLLRHTWFLTFLGITSVVHLGLVVAVPRTDLDFNEFRLFLSTDVLAQVGLAFALEKLVSLRTLTRGSVDDLHRGQGATIRRELKKIAA
jgi:hypothetical protein